MNVSDGRRGSSELIRGRPATGHRRGSERRSRPHRRDRPRVALDLRIVRTVAAVAIPDRRSRFQEMDETGVIAPVAGSSRQPAEPAPGPGWLRFGLGLIVLTRETLGSVLADVGGPAGSTTPAEPAAAPTTPSAHHAAWGLLVDALGRGRRAPALVRGYLSHASSYASSSARRFGPSLATARRLARRLPGATRSTAHWEAWRARRRAQLARWAAVGRREEAASRTVTRKALTALREAALARVAESPDLKRVIREQSEGIAVTAVTKLRNLSASADALAERAVSRLVGRRGNGGAG